MVGEKSGPKALSYECINYLFASPQWMYAMLQSPSGDLFNFLMTTLFNTVKTMQADLKEVDFSMKQDTERCRIFSSNSLDLTAG
jgi:hypothetical protein